MTWKRILLLLILLGSLSGGVWGWVSYQRVRADYDAYRQLIQQGVHVAGIPVGWRTAEEARELVEREIAEPFYQEMVVLYGDESVRLSPAADLKLKVQVDEMVAAAVQASHRYDYWEGFWLWIQGEAESLELDVPLELMHDPSAASRILDGIAEEYAVGPVEPMVDVAARAFLPGRPGRFLQVEPAAAQLNDLVVSPQRTPVRVAAEVVEPDQSRGRIQAMLSTLGPVMEQAPSPPRFFTATVPVSTTGGVQGTPRVDYTGELTWTFQQFAGYQGPLTTTTGFFFQLGVPGSRFDVVAATQEVERALQSGITTAITFDPEPVPPPPITPDLLIPPLEARLGRFTGVSSILVKNLDTGELVYEANADHLMSGMSVVKIGIMVEVYRHLGGKVDEKTHTELLNMLGSESCNPCANRLLAAVGSGSGNTGAQRVTSTMRTLGLENFFLCAPFRIVERPEGDGMIVYTSYVPLYPPVGALSLTGETPLYDRCVRTTPGEMANLLEMIHDCTAERGTLLETYPEAFSPEVCQEMIDIMAAYDLRNMLGAGIPAEVKLAHKHGFAGYDVPWGDTRAEVGIVFSPGATWLVSFYIWDNTPWLNWGVVQPLYRDVSNMLYNYFNPDAPYWPPPQWAPPPEEVETAPRASFQAS